MQKATEAFNALSQSNTQSSKPTPVPSSQEEYTREIEAPFSGFAMEFFENHVKPTTSFSTARSYEQILRVHFFPFFGHMNLHQIQRFDVARYRAQKRAKLSAKTVNNHISLLSTMFKKAIDWGYAHHNPAELPRLKIEEKEMNWLEEWEVEQLLNAVREVYPQWEPFFVTALFTGMRLGELCALKWKSVYFDRCAIQVCASFSNGHLKGTKSRKIRIVPLHHRVKEVLWPRKGQHDQLVFPNKKGNHLTQSMVANYLSRSLKYVGLRRIRIHDLRHTFASQSVMKGIPLPQVQQWLGHADIRTTMRYAHLAPAMGYDWIQRLGTEPEVPRQVLKFKQK